VNNALMQFQSDLLRVPVVRPRTIETTALGAAYLAGLAVGFWKNRAEIATLWKASQTFRPQASRAAMQKLQSEWRRAVARAKSWAV
jgi:glycerol kinase